MAIATFHEGEAGPSRIPAKRIAAFAASDDEDESSPGVGSPSPNARKKVNGIQHAGVNGHVNGDSKTDSPSRKKLLKSNNSQESSGSAEAKRKRREKAEKLFEARRELPFYQARSGILEEILAHDTTIIIGETGCGKSTQLPQLLRSHTLPRNHYSPNDPDAPPFKRGPSIAITQPRRLPTIALANRVSDEMGCLVGEEVGYTVRFEDVTGRDTKIRYMTEGVLMRELANGDRPQRREPASNGDTNHRGLSGEATGESSTSDHNLNLLLKYDMIVVDEAHERTLNTDFLCGALKQVQRIRKRLVKEQQEVPPNGDSLDHNMDGSSDARDKGKGKARNNIRELKIVVMSATLDPGKFQRFFETGRDALFVKGRIYDVATRHTVNPVDDFIEAAAKNVMQLHSRRDADGDVLVFMPGSEEIENCCELLRRASKELPEGSQVLQVLPLYAALPPAAQTRIFATKPKNTRRVVVATNIAETSITIPGIGYVIDTGYKKEKEYIFRASGAIEHLAKKSISKAAAWQRTGRAGRERNGECFRLFSQTAFEKLDAFDAPEIQRCNLASAVLQLIAMGLDPFEFEYIDNPGRDPIAAAFQTLAGLGAIDSPTAITPIGKSMLFYPLDPSHARILLAAFELGCPSEIIDILSLLVSGQIWVDRSSDRESTSSAKLKFLHRDGDHLTGLNVFRAYVAVKEQKSNLLSWCKENFVNSRTMSAAIKVRDQLRDLATRDGRQWNTSCGGETSLVMRALLQGLYMNTALIQPDGTYRQTAGSLQVKIHPSSALMSKKVPAILYDELTITSSIYARNVSSFEQQWLGEVPWFKQNGAAITSNNERPNL